MMEELKTVIKALKQAEKALDREGFILRWKVRVRADQGFFREMVRNLIAHTTVPAAETTTKAAPKKAKARDARPKALDVASGQATQARAPETPQAAAQVEAVADEEEPVTALNIKLAANYLGVSVPGVYDLIKRGKIPAHGKVGARWFLTEELDRHIQARAKRLADKKN
ncbi:MAG: helix-turn-helix domain-containing protein [Treponema sp.]|jgi:excisionase family DNA binding protein|nr:helix-turn-helix domain-containing protein [Treponema sp.]